MRKMKYSPLFTLSETANKPEPHYDKSVQYHNSGIISQLKTQAQNERRTKASLHNESSSLFRSIETLRQTRQV